MDGCSFLKTDKSKGVGQINRQTERQTDGQTDRQEDRWIDGQMD